MSLLTCIYYLGFSLGFRYWQTLRYYKKHPAHFPDLIRACRYKAFQEPSEAAIWNSWADQCEKSYQNYLRRKKN